MRICKNCIACMLLLALASLARAGDGRPLDARSAIEQGRPGLAAFVDDSAIPALSVAVAVDGRIVWSEAFGFADLENRVPASTLTRFRIASVSKPLTATVAARLHEKGVLDLDAPVQKYLPEYPQTDKPITARLLAGHLSGVRHYQAGEINSTREYPSLRSALSIFSADPLKNPPGEAYSYSTYGYTLLGAVMEAAAERSFPALMRELLFEPLEMRGAAADFNTPILPHRARPYVYNGQQQPENAPLTDHSYKLPGGGIVATAEDLVRLGSALIEPGFLKAETLQMLFEPMKTADGQSTRYALGWSIGRDWSGRRTIGHGGNQPGGRSHLMIYPDQRVVIAMLTNIANAPFGGDGVQVIADPFLEAVEAVATNVAIASSGEGSAATDGESPPASNGYPRDVDPAGVYELRATSGDNASARVEIWQTGGGWSGSISTSDGKHGRLASVAVEGDHVRTIIVGNRAIFALRFTLADQQATGDVNLGARKVPLAGERTTTPADGAARIVARAVAHFLAQRWPQAAEAYRQVVRDQPDNGEAHFRLAYALLLSKTDYERAAQACERAAELGYQRPISLYNAACAYSQLKQLDRAFDFLRRSLDAGFNQPDTLQNDPDIENLRADPRFQEVLRERRR